MKTLRIIPNESFQHAGQLVPSMRKGQIYVATIATNQPQWREEGKVFVNGMLLTKADYTLAPVYRKNSIEAKLDSLLPQFPSYDVIAHELWADGEGSWSVNDSWHLARGCDREDAISHLANRWQVFKANYAPKARVRDLTDANYSGAQFPALLDCIPFAEFPSLLEVDGIPFAEVRNGGEE